MLVRLSPRVYVVDYALHVVANDEAELEQAAEEVEELVALQTERLRLVELFKMALVLAGL